MTASTPQQPLILGRILRVAAGLACFASIPLVPLFEHTWLSVAALVAAGATFVAAGVTANPGCEITALPNLFLPRGRRIHCWCPLFTPLDRLEQTLRRHWRSARRSRNPG